MCCSYGCEVWSVISSEDIGCQVQLTGPKREFVTGGQTENVANDELHNVCHLSCVGSLKNSFKACISFLLRRTIMKFVVKCSAIQNFLLQLKNKKPTGCHLLYLLYFLDIQHVSGINMTSSWFFYSSIITMMHGPINIRIFYFLLCMPVCLHVASKLSSIFIYIY